MSEEQVTEPMQTAGLMLRKAREAKGFSVNDMAKELRLSAAQIENLEADQFLEFKTPTFVRGYLRAYAKLVNIDEATLFKVFEQQDNRKPDVGEMRSFSHKEARKRGDKGTLLIGVCVILVVAFGVFGWIYQNSSTSISEQYFQTQPSSSSSSSSRVESSIDATDGTSEDLADATNLETTESNIDSVEQSSLDSDVIETADSFEAATIAEPTSAPQVAETPEVEIVLDDEVPSDATMNSSFDETETAETPDSDSNAFEIPSTANDNISDVVDEQATANDDLLQEAESVIQESNTIEEFVEPVAEPQTTAGNDASEQALATDMPVSDGGIVPVELHFGGECWAKLVDATGETLILGVKGKGHVSKVQGVAPFQVLLGNPDAVEIYLDGQKVQKPDTPRGAIAKFNLPIVE